MRKHVGRLVLGLSGIGFPLTQLAIRRFGRAGACVTEAVSVGLLVRDAALITGGAPARLRRAPAALLYAELSAALVASILGLPVVAGEDGRRAAVAERPRGLEIARRGAVGLLFGLHTLRFRIYLRPDRGRRPLAAA